MRQKDLYFKSSVGYRVRLYCKKKKKKNWYPDQSVSSKPQRWFLKAIWLYLVEFFFLLLEVKYTFTCMLVTFWHYSMYLRQSTYKKKRFILTLSLESSTPWPGLKREKEEGTRAPRSPLSWLPNDLKSPSKPHLLKVPSLPTSSKLGTKLQHMGLWETFRS
jgi:hypothetical protein